MKKQITLTTLNCKRCGHKWIPRQVDVVICPNCKSARWMEARKKR